MLNAREINDAEIKATASAATVEYVHKPLGEPQKDIKRDQNSNADKESPASQLIEIGKRAELFSTSSGDPFATVQVENHYETWPLKSDGFRHWLAKLYYDATQRGISQQAINDALSTLEATAKFSGTSHEVFTRVAEKEKILYLDLADSSWRAVRVSEHGWNIVGKPGVKFVRSHGMLSLPEPVRGGSINELRSFLNIANEDDFKLMVAWVLAALTYGKPYPLLVLGGEQGCAKSTTSRLLRSLVDPNKAPLRTAPTNQRDLAVTVNNSHVYVLDNVSVLQNWMSDSLCRLATGAAYTARKNYTDDQEMIFEARRPVIINGIGDVAAASDLLDRAITLTLPVIENHYRTETEIQAAFGAALPRILGALLDVMVHGLRNEGSTDVVRNCRMTDFATWITACESGLGWDKGTFAEIYRANRKEGQQIAADASPLVEPIRALMAAKRQWSGSANDLLILLGNQVDDSILRRPNWPKTPEKLASELKRIAPIMRAEAITIEKSVQRQGGTGKRLWVITDVKGHLAVAA